MHARSAARRALALPRRGLARFGRGLGFVLRGAKLVFFEELGLARYWLAPIAITLVALAGAAYGAYALHGRVLEWSALEWMWGPPADGGWFVDFVRGAVSVLVAIVLGAAALVATIAVSSVAAAPFNARLAEVLDERITGFAPPPLSLGRIAGDVGRTLVLETLFFLVNAVLFVLSLALPFASPVIGFVGLVLNAYYFAFAYLEVPHASRDRGLRDRLRSVLREPMVHLGFGTGAAFFLCVPLLNLVFMPAAIAGGVLLHASLEAEASSSAA